MNKKIFFIFLLVAIAYFSLTNSEITNSMQSLIGTEGAFALIIMLVLLLIYLPLRQSEGKRKAMLVLPAFVIILMIAACGLIGSGA